MEEDPPQNVAAPYKGAVFFAEVMEGYLKCDHLYLSTIFRYGMVFSALYMFSFWRWFKWET